MLRLEATVSVSSCPVQGLEVGVAHAYSPSTQKTSAGILQFPVQFILSHTSLKNKTKQNEHFHHP